MLDERSLGAGNNFTLDTDLGPLDLLGWVEPIGEYDAIETQCVDVPLGVRTVRVLSVDALIRIKSHINRPKDQASLAELRAIKAEGERRG